jgi:hypothetical protein
VQFKAGDTHIEPPPPAEVNVTTPEVKVDANTTIEKGAVEAPVVNVEAAEAPEVKFEKGAIQNTVEAAPPANVNINEGALSVDVAPANVNVEAAEAPNVNVEVRGGKKRVIRDDKGHIESIEEE